MWQNRFSFFSFCYLLLFSFIFTSAHSSIPKIEVLIGKSIPKIIIKGENITKTYSTFNHIKNETKEVKTYPGKNTIVLNCNSSLKDKWSQGILVAELSSTSGVIEWKNAVYKGDLSIIRKPAESSCHIVQALSLEHYLSTLLGKEMNKNWPLEALKAQAVAARSYALYKMQKRKSKDSSQSFYDLESSEKDQVNGSLSDINSNTIKATFLTEGEVLLNKQAKIDPIFYHAQCGGKTLLPKEVWSDQVDDYQRVACHFCQTSKDGKWIRDITQKFFLGALKQKQKKIINIIDKSKYAANFRVVFSDGVMDIDKGEFRRLFGKSLIRSNRFLVRYESVNSHGRVYIDGQGLGHGVGLCQLGALDLAKRGLNYKQILEYYYPGHKLTKVYGKSTI